MTQPTTHAPTHPLELWGGIEASVVRIGNEVRDQLQLTGHRNRPEDLKAFATLGLRALRYPLLWDDPFPATSVDWGWADERLQRLRELGIRPIVGLLHHGGGPLPGGLLDPDFVDGFVAHARRVAERYPWIDAYTPVNEPGTTARFAGLYGLWHPHGTDVGTFGRCFLNQCLATRAAMKAIREVNPQARLVQTEDVGKTHSTQPLAYQAEYENERRWITFDVLCGRVDPRHPVHAHLLRCGVSPAALESFVDDPCPPDILGMNHYVTSERFLDERLERYPQCTHGGNEREAYADVEAVRVRAEGLVGFGGLLRELWARYRRPLAMTEVQLACTREEQMRWLAEAWREAEAARADGVDVRALTAWALLGSFDWDSLLVHSRGHYESGAFDVRGPKPRRTAVGAMLAELGRGVMPGHPVLQAPGWWRRPVRLEYEPVSAPRTGAGTAHAREPAPEGRPLLVAGANGTLGRAFARLCALRGLPAVSLRRKQLDVEQPELTRKVLETLRPWAVVNCTGYLKVDAAEHDRAGCVATNTHGAANLAGACAALGVPYLTFSSDLVFDGEGSRPYVESDPPNPINCYGRTKHLAEGEVTARHPGALIVRTSALFGPWDDFNFATLVLRALAAGERVLAATDQVVSPTYVPDLVNTALDLLIDGETGLWHLANVGAVSWYDWAVRLAEAAGLPRERIVRASAADLGWIAARPRYSVLGSERGQLLPSLEHALARYLAHAPALRSQAAE